MKLAPSIPAMLAVLQQGKCLYTASLCLVVAATLSLGIGTHWSVSAAMLLLASITGGVVQTYYALRITFDAALLENLLAEGLEGMEAAKHIDAALLSLGFNHQRSTDQSAGWDQRWYGMRRLLHGQLACLAVQVMTLLVGLYLH